MFFFELLSMKMSEMSATYLLDSKSSLITLVQEYYNMYCALLATVNERQP